MERKKDILVSIIAILILTFLVVWQFTDGLALFC